MQIIDDTPRPDASKQVAAAHRHRPTADDTAPVAPPRQLLGIAAALVVGALIVMITWQLTNTTPRALVVATPVATVPATVQPAALSVPTRPTSTPVLPTATPAPQKPTEAAPVGQGMTWIEPTAVPVVIVEPRGGSVAPIGCPFPIIDGVCANGNRSQDYGGGTGHTSKKSEGK